MKLDGMFDEQESVGNVCQSGRNAEQGGAAGKSPINFETIHSFREHIISKSKSICPSGESSSTASIVVSIFLALAVDDCSSAGELSRLFLQSWDSSHDYESPEGKLSSEQLCRNMLRVIAFALVRYVPFHHTSTRSLAALNPF